MYFGGEYDSQIKQWLFCKTAQFCCGNSESLYEAGVQFVNTYYTKSVPKMLRKKHIIWTRTYTPKMVSCHETGRTFLPSFSVSVNFNNLIRTDNIKPQFKNNRTTSRQHNYIVCSIYLCNMFQPQRATFRLKY